MKDFYLKHKNQFATILSASITVLLIFLVIIHDPAIKTRTSNHFTNSNLTVLDMYTDGDDTYMILEDKENDFTVTIKNSIRYDSYQIGQTINANRYITVHEDGKEEVIYFFTDKK